MIIFVVFICFVVASLVFNFLLQVQGMFLDRMVGFGLQYWIESQGYVYVQPQLHWIILGPHNNYYVVTLTTYVTITWDKAVKQEHIKKTPCGLAVNNVPHCPQLVHTTSIWYM